MAYGVITNVSAPVAAYDGVHAALMRRSDELDDIGLVTHLGRLTSEGFQTVEVWESKERYDHFMAEVFPGVMAEVLGDAPSPPAPPQIEVFEVRGLVVPGAGLAF